MVSIAIVNGSPRPRGATGRLLREAQVHLAAKPDTSVRFYDLAAMDMRFCKGCIHCYKTGECLIQDDGVERVAAELREVDAIIMGSPTYGSNVTGLLKNFMDRGHFLLEQSFSGKQAFALGTYEIADGGQVIRVLKKFFVVSGATMSGTYIQRLDHGADPLGSSQVRRSLHKKLDRFHRYAVRGKSKGLWEHLFSDVIVAGIVWKPVFAKNPQKYAGITDAWEARKS